MISDTWQWLMTHFGVVLFYAFFVLIFVFWIVSKYTVIRDGMDESRHAQDREITPNERVRKLRTKQDNQANDRT